MEKTIKKVIIINGSPRGAHSSTYRMIKALAEGMTLADAEVKIYHLVQKHIDACTGCFACWTVSPGKCTINDDMENILLDYTNSDLVVFATPLHTYMMTSLLKIFIDRCFPLHTSMMSQSTDGYTTLGSRHNKPEKVLLLANCGFPEKDHFEPLVNYMKWLCQRLDKQYSGHILQCMGEMLKKPTMQNHLMPYYTALKRVGKQLINEGVLSEHAEEYLDSKWPIKDAVPYQSLANYHYELKQNTLAEYQQRKDVNNEQ